MSWIMKAKILNIEQVSVYAETKEYMHFVKIQYKWEVVKWKKFGKISKGMKGYIK